MADPEDRTAPRGPWTTDDTLAFDLAYALPRTHVLTDHSTGGWLCSLFVLFLSRESVKTGARLLLWSG